MSPPKDWMKLFTRIIKKEICECLEHSKGAEQGVGVADDLAVNPQKKVESLVNTGVKVLEV